MEIRTRRKEKPEAVASEGQKRPVQEESGPEKAPLVYIKNILRHGLDNGLFLLYLWAMLIRAISFDLGPARGPLSFWR